MVRTKFAPHSRVRDDARASFAILAERIAAERWRDPARGLVVHGSAWFSRRGRVSAGALGKADIQLPYADLKLWRIFCRAAAAGSLEGFRARIEQESRLEVAESEFVQRIRSLSASLPWKYIYAMRNKAEDPVYKDIWLQWVEAAQFIIEGRIDDHGL